MPSPIKARPVCRVLYFISLRQTPTNLVETDSKKNIILGTYSEPYGYRHAFGLELKPIRCKALLCGCSVTHGEGLGFRAFAENQAI